MSQTTLKDNIQSNKTAILYYTGVFLVSALNVAVKNLDNVIPQDIWWGAVINGIADLGLIYFTIIAKFIFGKDADLDRVKWERQQLGEENTSLQIKNEGLRVTNQMQKQIMDEAGVTKFDYNYEVPKKDPLDTSELDKLKYSQE